MCAQRCMGVGRGSGTRAPATILHAETSSENGDELRITLHALLGVRRRGRGARAISPRLVSIWSGFRDAAARLLHRFAPLLHRCVGLDCALPRVVAVGRGVVVVVGAGPGNNGSVLGLWQHAHELKQHQQGCVGAWQQQQQQQQQQQKRARGTRPSVINIFCQGQSDRCPPIYCPRGK